MNLNFMKLREQMKNQKVSYYLVPSEDPHQSEYVDDHFKCRQYISGFTGSAGTFLAGCEEGWLWTDGRYFTQAEGQGERSVDWKQKNADREKRLPEISMRCPD